MMWYVLYINLKRCTKISLNSQEILFFFKFALSLFDQKIGALDPRKERSSGRLRFFPVHLFDHWMMGVYHCKLTFINLDKPHDQ